MPVCFGYTRESTRDQANGLEVQAEAVGKYYREKLLPKFPDLIWGGIYQDKATSAGISFSERRAGHEVNLRANRSDHIVVSKLDRGYRDTLDFLTMERAWEDRGITLHVLDLPWLDADLPKYIRDMIRTVLAMIAQFERERIRERTREVKQWLKRQGRPTNGEAGYGFKFEGPTGKRRRVPDKKEREQMAYIVKSHLQGSTWEEIYFHFLEHDIRTREGKEWSLSRIRRACAAEFYLQAQELGSKVNVNGAGASSASK